MSERYTKLFSLPQKLYVEGSPVIISAGALLKDNTTDKLLVQLKITNITNRRIKALKVEIEQLDTVKRRIEKPIEFYYLDIDCHFNSSFGTQTPIYLSSQHTRSFNVNVTEIDFLDNSLIKLEKSFGEWQSIQEPKKLTNIYDDDFVNKFREIHGHNSIVIPFKEKDIWYCSCGCLNKSSEPICYKCNSKFFSFDSNNENEIRNLIIDEKYQKALNCSRTDIKSVSEAIELLNEIPEWKDSADKIKELTEIHDELNKNLQKQNRLLKKSAVIILSITASVILLFSIINNLKPVKYAKAEAAFGNSDFLEAYDIYTELGDYKDSKQKRLDVMYGFWLQCDDYENYTFQKFNRELIEAGYI